MNKKTGINYPISNETYNNCFCIFDSTKQPSLLVNTILYQVYGIQSATDYYPFGMPMPNRTFSADNYRFGFNAQEKTDEISGSGNHNTAEFWEYDTRLGRRWNIDPVTEPSESGYVVNGNNPNYYSDPLGDFKTWFGAWLYSLTHKGVTKPYKASKKSKEWVVNKKAYMEGNQTVVSVISHWDNTSNGIFITGDDDGSQSPGRKANKIWGSFNFSELENIFSILKTSLIRDLTLKIKNPLVEIGEKMKGYLFDKKKEPLTNDNQNKDDGEIKTNKPSNQPKLNNKTNPIDTYYYDHPYVNEKMLGGRHKVIRSKNKVISDDVIK